MYLCLRKVSQEVHVDFYLFTFCLDPQPHVQRGVKSEQLGGLRDVVQ